MLEFLGSQDVIIFFVIFLVFVFLAYKFVKFVFKTLMIGLVASVFPVFSNLFLEWDIPINLSSMIWFAVTGMGLFLLYSFIRIWWKGLKLAFAPLKTIFKRKKEGEKS